MKGKHIEFHVLCPVGVRVIEIVAQRWEKCLDWVGISP